MERIDKDIKDQFKTGDLLLFHSNTNYFGRLIQYFTGSDYSHVGIILKDPNFTEKKMVGLFFWESSWENYPDAEDNKIKVGVEIVHLDELIEKCGNINLYYRKLTLKNGKQITDEKLKEIHDVVHDKPYDSVIHDWVEAFFKIDTRPQKVDRFWCSAFVGYFYVKIGILPEDLDWSILRPDYFSEENSECELIDAELGPQIKIK